MKKKQIAAKLTAIILSAALAVPNCAQAAGNLKSTGAAPETKASTATAASAAKETAGKDSAAEAPATEAPATEAPVTEAPATEAPETEPPATEAPETEPPATEPPATEAPETEPPATEPPATEAPETELPATEPPATEAPETEAPSTDGTEPPTTEGGETPSTEGTETEAPATESESQGTEKENSKESESKKKDSVKKEKKKKKSATKKKEKEEAEEKEEELEAQPLSREALLALIQGTTPPKIQENFRFVTVEKEPAIVRVKKAAIYEEMDQKSKAVGSMKKTYLCYVLKTVDENWVYVESGDVRGFVEADKLATGEKAEHYLKAKGESQRKTAKALVSREENKAYTYTLTTTKKTTVKKRYAIADTESGNVMIRQGKSKETAEAGKLKDGALCYILADAGEEWTYVESGDVRGFVKSEYLITGEEAKAQVKEKGEENFDLAEQTVSPKENAAYYYTMTTVQEGGVAKAIQESLTSFARQFEGKSYAEGGISLLGGADNTGFVQSLFSQYTYSLPRTVKEQAKVGETVKYRDIEPGDLVFYGEKKVPSHVSVYLGEGQVIHAKDAESGIVIEEIQKEKIVSIRRLIKESDQEVVSTVNESADKVLADSYMDATSADIGEKLGTFKLTAYCSCSKCCGKWSGGPTASGTVPTQGRTVAMGGIPFGTRLVINGHIYTVEDRGTPYGHVDIYLNSHDSAVMFGLQAADVYLAK